MNFFFLIYEVLEWDFDNSWIAILFFLVGCAAKCGTCLIEAVCSYLSSIAFVCFWTASWFEYSSQTPDPYLAVV